VPKQGDRVQREIEELLDQLDSFVPEERFLAKVKNKRKQEAGPSLLARTWTAVKRPFAKITLGHVMLTGLALVVATMLVGGLFGSYRGWFALLGAAMIIGAFVMSFLGWDSRRTIAGGRVEKRWRGQVISYDEGSRSQTSRISNWFRGRGRK
jgi:hypothetical protein